MHMESMCCVPSGGRGSCAHLHSLVWWMGGEDQIGDCFLQVPMCPFWSQRWFCSHPQGGKGEQGLPGPLGPKGEKGARVSAPAMATAPASYALGVDWDVSHHPMVSDGNLQLGPNGG